MFQLNWMGSNVAMLESPKQDRPTQFHFLGADNTLIAFYHHAGEMHIWRINELSDRLNQMGLYFLSMCYWQLNEHQHSRETLELAERMFRLKLPPDIEALRELEAFQKEACELIRKGNPRE